MVSDMHAGCTMCGRRSADAAMVALGLDELGNPQDVTQPLALDDRALVDLTELVIGGVGQRGTRGTDLDPSVGELEHVDVLADQPSVFRCVGEQIEFALVM